MSTNHPLFPVQLPAKWQDASSFSIADTLRDWLLNPASLTTRLQSHCDEFRVELLGQHIEQCNKEEANEDITAGEEVLVREVLLWCDNKPQVFARSLLPLTSLTGEQQALAHLGTNSLGQVLFNHKNLQRKHIQIAHIENENCISRLCTAVDLPEAHSIYARRSTFLIENKPVLVAEVFLPNAFAYNT